MAKSTKKKTTAVKEEVDWKKYDKALAGGMDPEDALVLAKN